MRYPIRIAIWVNGQAVRYPVGLTARHQPSLETVVRRVTHQHAPQQER